MGGSTERGNRAPYAEFNAWADPEAAEAVLASGIPFTMIGLNLTHQALATPEVIARIGALGTPLGRLRRRLARVLRVDLPRRCSASRRRRCTTRAPSRSSPSPAVVRCVDRVRGDRDRGRAGRAARPSSTSTGGSGARRTRRVAVELDAERFWDLVVDAVARLGR